MTNYDEIACWNALKDALRDRKEMTINGDGTLFVGTHGFQVAGPTCELRISDSASLDQAAFEVAIWLRVTRYGFDIAPNLGIWRDVETGDWCVDRSVHILGRADAMTTGLQFNQRAIYDWAARRGINCATGEYI